MQRRVVVKAESSTNDSNVSRNVQKIVKGNSCLSVVDRAIALKACINPKFAAVNPKNKVLRINGIISRRYIHKLSRLWKPGLRASHILCLRSLTC